MLTSDTFMSECEFCPFQSAMKIISETFFPCRDLGLINGKSNLVVSGRVSDLIIKGGVNISPAEIEPVLLEHPNVLEAHVVGVRDDRLGEEICAWIKIRKDHEVSDEAVKAFAAQKVSSHPKIFYLSLAIFP